MIGGDAAGMAAASNARRRRPAAVLAAGTTVDDLLNFDLSYAPPFGPVWGPVLIAARQWAEVGRA